MAIYLTDLANWLREGQLAVVEYSGWQTRARGSGGYSAMPLCVMWHHTASPRSWDGKKDADYCAVGDKDAPLANLYIDRQGTVWVLAAGATNTNGKGNSIRFSRGTVPADSMNTRAVGVEMGNDGVGELWPQAQIDAMFIVSNIVNAKCGNEPDDVSTHQFYAPTRKIDPATCNVAGPWVPPSVTSSGTWDRAAVQAECRNRAGKPQPPQPPQPPPQGDWWTPTINAMPTLRRGDSGPFVKRMQHLMCAVGAMDQANTANYDGVFGGGTEGALNRWKQSIGAQADGTCDPWTWGALMHTIDGIPNLAKGATGDDVKRMQHLLTAAGYMNNANVSNYDGVWGNGTDGAKQRFDKDYGLGGGSDTSCGPKSWQSLLNGTRW